MNVEKRYIGVGVFGLSLTAFAWLLELFGVVPDEWHLSEAVLQCSLISMTLPPLLAVAVVYVLDLIDHFRR